MKMPHVVPMLAVRSMPASVEFYTQLGFEVERREDSWGWARLRFGESFVMLDQSINTAPTAPRLTVLYLYPDDVRAYHAQLRSRGLTIPDLETTFYDMLEFRMEDPDGNRLWIGQSPQTNP